MRILRALSMLPLLLLPFGVVAQERCGMPDSLRFVDTPLPNLAQGIKARGELRITVLGTSSSLKHESGGIARTYVAGLQEALEARFPTKRFTIDNRSVRTQSVQDMLRRISAEVIPAKPDLLVWQTGNVEAARQTDINSFGEPLSEGLKLLRKAGIDVILIAPQYRARLSPMVDAGRIDQYMGWIADAAGVPVFPRYDMMKFWAENGVFDLQAKNQETQMNEAGMMNGCLAQHLAEMIRRAVLLPPP